MLRRDAHPRALPASTSKQNVILKCLMVHARTHSHYAAGTHTHIKPFISMSFRGSNYVISRQNFQPIARHDFHDFISHHKVGVPFFRCRRLHFNELTLFFCSQLQLNDSHLLVPPVAAFNHRYYKQHLWVRVSEESTPTSLTPFQKEKKKRKETTTRTCGECQRPAQLTTLCWVVVIAVGQKWNTSSHRDGIVPCYFPCNSVRVVS